MVRRLSILVAVFLPVVLAFGIVSARAGAAQLGCTGGAASAIDQYCETIPRATGSQPPRVGAPILASTLGRRAVRALSHPSSPRNLLLTIPASVRHPASVAPHARGAHPIRDARAGTTASGLSGPVSVLSLSLTLILILVAIALALTAAAIARWRLRSRAN